MTTKTPMTEDRKRDLVSRFGPSRKQFVKAIYWTANRCLLVHLQLHAHRKYVVCKPWWKHRVKGCWYPGRASLVMPLDRAKGVAEAIMQAANGVGEANKPDWLVEREQVEAAEERFEWDRRERV